MQGWMKDEGRLGCPKKEAHGLCLFGANLGVALVIRRVSVRGWKTLRECEGIRWSYYGFGLVRGVYEAFMVYIMDLGKDVKDVT